MSNLAPRILPPPQIPYNKRRIKSETVVRFRLGHHDKSYSLASKPRPAGHWRKPASQNEHNSAVMMHMEHRQLTLMFTDIVGYSRLMGRDETAAIELLGEYRRILLARIEEFQGTLIEFAGDAIFARFDCPIAAVQAAVAIQKDLGVFNRERDKTLPLLQSRIGIHAGEVALRDNAVFGDDVNIAARLEPIAVADGVCVSGEVYKAVKDVIHEPVLSLGKQTLKNIENKIKVYLIRPAGITLGTHAHYFWRTCQLKLGAYRYPIAASVLLLIAAGFYFVPRWLVPGYDANYVEIADFQNLTNDEADYFSAGITEALRAQLADIRDVYILDADEGVRAPIRLEGNVQRVGDNLRIAYRLFRRKDNVQIAGGKLDGAYNDIFILQDRVVAEIAGYLAEEFGLRNFRPAALKLTSDVTAYDYYLQGLSYLKMPSSQKNLDSAIQMFSTALIHDPDFTHANAGLCKVYASKYDDTHIQSWVSKAEEYCQLALLQDDSLPTVYEALGKIYMETGRFSEAISIFKKAISYDPSNVDVLIKLAYVYKFQNQLELAEATFKKAVDKQPNYWRSIHQLANFYAQTGHLRRAIREYKKVLKITPENAIAYSNLGGTYVYLGNLKEAAEAFKRSANLSPTSLNFTNSGMMYFLSRDFKNAANAYREAIRLSPNDYGAYIGLADSLRHLSQDETETTALYTKAISMAKKALQVNPHDLDAQQHLMLGYLFTGESEKAKSILDQANSVDPEDINNLYIKVKYWTVVGNFEKAIETTNDLVEAGYPSQFIEADPDLELLVRLPTYQNLAIANKN